MQSTIKLYFWNIYKACILCYLSKNVLFLVGAAENLFR